MGCHRATRCYPRSTLTSVLIFSSSAFFLFLNLAYFSFLSFFFSTQIFLSRALATLYDALSVGRSVGPKRKTREVWKRAMALPRVCVGRGRGWNGVVRPSPPLRDDLVTPRYHVLKRVFSSGIQEVRTNRDVWGWKIILFTIFFPSLRNFFFLCWMFSSFPFVFLFIGENRI